LLKSLAVREAYLRYGKLLNFKCNNLIIRLFPLLNTVPYSKFNIVTPGVLISSVTIPIRKRNRNECLRFRVF